MLHCDLITQKFVYFPNKYAVLLPASFLAVAMATLVYFIASIARSNLRNFYSYR